ncbi:hypothetical protein D3C86_1911480 [compost metagenome]
MSVYVRGTAIRQEQRGEYPKNARLARPVRPYQPKKLALVYGKRYIVYRHGLFFPVGFGQIFDNNRFHYFSATSPYMPIFRYPSFLTLIFTAYTRLARSSLV